jgi:hypothetical protein
MLFVKIPQLEKMKAGLRTMYLCHCCQLLYQDVLKDRELELQGSAAAGLVSQGKIVGRLSESSRDLPNFVGGLEKPNAA